MLLLYRLAIKYGANIVPIFVLGGSKLFNRIVLPKFIEDFSRQIKISLLLFYGKYGLPIPLERNLLYAVGRSIITYRNTNPSIEEIDFIHNIFCQELITVFNIHKSEYGWGHKSLEIV